MKDRIKQYMDYKSISAGELSSTLEVQRSNISHILNGRNKPGASFIEKLLKNFPDLNARWLLTGDGEMVVNNVVPKEQQTVIQHNNSVVSEEPVQRLVESLTQKPITVDNEKKIDRLVLLYTDGTFTDFKKE